MNILWKKLVIKNKNWFTEKKRIKSKINSTQINKTQRKNAKWKEKEKNKIKFNTNEQNTTKKYNVRKLTKEKLKVQKK